MTTLLNCSRRICKVLRCSTLMPKSFSFRIDDRIVEPSFALDYRRQRDGIPSRYKLIYIGPNPKMTYTAYIACLLIIPAAAIAGFYSRYRIDNTIIEADNEERTKQMTVKINLSNEIFNIKDIKESIEESKIKEKVINTITHYYQLVEKKVNNPGLPEFRDITSSDATVLCTYMFFSSLLLLNVIKIVPLRIYFSEKEKLYKVCNTCIRKSQRVFTFKKEDIQPLSKHILPEILFKVGNRRMLLIDEFFEDLNDFYQLISKKY